MANENLPPILTRVTVDGVRYDDYQRLRVDKNTDEYNSSSNFQVTYDSPFGRHAGDFQVGQELITYADVVAEQKVEYMDGFVGFFTLLQGDTWKTQTFTIGTLGPNSKINLTRLNLMLARKGSPGDLTVSIKAVDGGGEPTGADLSTGTIDEDDVSLTNWGWINVDMTAFEMQPNTQYAIVLRALDGDASNFYGFSSNYDLYSGGRGWSSTDAGSTWDDGGGADFLFRVFGTSKTDAGKKLITGVIEKVNFKGEENAQTVTLAGRDYSQRLQDATVEPVVYTNEEVSDIVKDIISNSVGDITVNNVETTQTTLKRIVFNHTSVFEALRQLAARAGYYFYVDNDKDLNFKLRQNEDSGIVLDNTNINLSSLNTTREGMCNSVYVYGERQLAGFQETFTAGSPVGGSVFELLSKPRNTLVTVDDVPSRGGVFEMVIVPTSGPGHLVSFDDKLIIFISGTDIGYSTIPASGAEVKVQYDRDIPIVKFGQDRDSISLFGKKEKVIDDRSINDPNTATDILKQELKKSNPFNGVECAITGWYDITPGQTARVTLSDFGLDTTVGILNASYIFDKNTINNQKIITIRLDKKVTDITDNITELTRRLGALEEADRQETDVITRLEQATNDLYVVGSYWEIRQRFNGSSFLLGGAPGSDGTLLGRLGSVVASGVSFLGDSQTAYETIRSGGFYI